MPQQEAIAQHAVKRQVEEQRNQQQAAQQRDPDLFGADQGQFVMVEPCLADQAGKGRADQLDRYPPGRLTRFGNVGDLKHVAARKDLVG